MTCILLTVIISIISAVKPVEFIVHPQSFNTTLNSTINFTCEAIAELIQFRVDDVLAAYEKVVNRGFNQTLMNILHDGKKTRLLSAKAFEDNNNTNISCTAYGSMNINSSIAVLRIQALLAPVKDLTATVLNGSSVLLMWSAPYTLDNVPITGYNINDDQGRLIDRVNTTEYILTGDYCDVTTVYVSGINGAGIGDSNNVTFYIARVPKTIPVSVISKLERDSILFQVFINVNGLCIGEYPTNVIVNIKDSNDVLQQTLSHDVTLSLVNNQLIIVNISSPVNLSTYLVEVTLSNPAGEFDHTINVFPFGFLTSVLNITSSLDNCTTITISWDRPNVDSRVHISYYILLIYDDVNKTLLQNVSINGNEYKYKDQELFRHRYAYTIYGINELGEGEHNNSTFSFQRVPKSAKENTTFTILSYINNELNLMFNISIILECSSEAPENSTVTVQCDDVIIFNKTYLIEYSSQPINIIDSQPLSAPQHQFCTLSIIFCNNAGHSDPLIHTLSTYDVINATAYPNGNSICVECVFSSASSAKSCYVSVIGVTSMNKKFVKNSPSDLTVQGCIDNLPAGNYTVNVYDVENNIPLTSILPAIILRDIIITDIVPTTTIIQSTTENITSSDIPIIIAVLVPLLTLSFVCILIIIVVCIYRCLRQGNDDIPPPIPANVQDDDIPPPIPADVQDDDIPPPIPANVQDDDIPSPIPANVQDDIPPPIPANVQDDDIPPPIPANVQDDDIPPPIPADVQDDDIPPPIPANLQDDDIPPPIPANVQDDDIPPPIPANLQDDDIPPPIPAYGQDDYIRTTFYTS